MARGKQTSKKQKEHYQIYKSTAKWMDNRVMKLERHLKKYPDDKQATKALKKGVEYRRKRPFSWNKVWSPINRDYAQLLREVLLNGNDALKPRFFMIMR